MQKFQQPRFCITAISHSGTYVGGSSLQRRASVFLSPRAFSVDAAALRRLTLREVSVKPFNNNPTTKPHDSSLSFPTGGLITKGAKANGSLITTLPWEKILGRPLVGSSQGLGSLLAVRSYLSVHVETFLHHTKHKRSIDVFPLRHRVGSGSSSCAQTACARCIGACGRYHEERHKRVGQGSQHTIGMLTFMVEA